MALTFGALIKDALQKANCPSYTAQADDEIILILQELAQTYDFEAAQGFLTGTFLSGIGGVVNSANVVAGSGPYQLPTDFLRMDFQDFFYQNGGINYFPRPRDRDEYDALIQQPGFTTNIPTDYFVDMSTTPPGLYLWPAPATAFPFFGRYSRQMPDPATPHSSAATPWFPSQAYLLQRLAGQMMGYTGDTRMAEWLGDENGNPPWSATGILKRFMAKEGNTDTRSVRVKLDPRSFSPSWSSLKPTKNIPW